MAANPVPDEVLRSTTGKANFQRVTRLLISGGTTLLREILDIRCPPSNLPAILKNPATEKQLKAAKLTKPQWDCLYPSPGVYGKSTDFDVTLLFKLLKTICNLIPPATGWDALPACTDHSLAADLARIKYYRNSVYGHVNQQMEVPDYEFPQLWQEIRKALLGIAGQISHTKKHEWQEAIDAFLKDPLTAEDERNTQELLRWYRNDMKVKESIEELKLTTHEGIKRLEGTADVTAQDIKDIKEMMRQVLNIHAKGTQSTEFKNKLDLASRWKHAYAIPRDDISVDAIPMDDISTGAIPDESTTPEYDVSREANLGVILSNGVISEDFIPDEVIPKDDISEDFISEDDFPEDDISEEAPPDEDISEKAIPEDEFKVDVIPEDGISDDYIPEDELSEEAIPEDVISEDDTPKDNSLEDDILEVAMPDDDSPEVDIPENYSPEVDIQGEDNQEVVIPEDDFPGINTPEEDIPEEIISETVIQAVDTRKVNIPDISIPEEEILEEIVSEEGIQEVDTRKVNIPDISTPGEEIPEEIVSETVIQEVDARKVNFPDISIPEEEILEEIVSEEGIQEVGIPEDNIPDISIPEEDIPERRKFQR
ncbi:hypothetical protein ACROYT_G035955 [Oculina patagonica]